MRAVLGPCLLILPGVLPALALGGQRARSIVLAPLAVAAMAGLGATLAVPLRLPLTATFAAAALVANGGALAALRQSTAPSPPPTSDGGGAATVSAAVAATVGLLALRAPTIDHDARSIWFLHARLFVGPSDLYANVMDDAAYRFSHMDYPPLVPSSVALTWRAAGQTDLRTAQIVTAVLGACALATLGWAVAAIARRVGAAPAVRAAAAAAAVLGCIAAAEGGLTRGYVDALAAAAAAGAALHALVLPIRRDTSLMVGLLAAVAALTKVEGSVAAGVVVGLYALRVVTSRSTQVSRSTLAGVVAAALAPAAAWYAAAVAMGAGLASAGYTSSAPDPGRPLDRIGATIPSVAIEVWPLPLAVVSSVLAWWLTSRSPARARWRPPTLLWLAVGVQLFVLVVGFVVGDYEIHRWLEIAASRSTMYARMVGIAELATLGAFLWATDPTRRSGVTADGAPPGRRWPSVETRKVRPGIVGQAEGSS